MQARYQATLRPEQKGESTSLIAFLEASGFFSPTHQPAKPAPKMTTIAQTSPSL